MKRSVFAALLAVGCGVDAPPTGPQIVDVGSADAAPVDASSFPPLLGPLPAVRPNVQVCLRDGTATSTTVPALLSATGCFSDLAALEPSPDLIPYDVNAPLWTDGTLKQRYMLIPVGTTIAVGADGEWTFPNGTVLLKNFLAQLGGVRRAIETRLMVKNAERWSFYNYRWNDEGTDASLLTGLDRRTVSLDDPRAPATIDYLFPNEESCRNCHSGAAGLVLGPRAEQFDRPLLHRPARNQLDALVDLGLFDGPLLRDPVRAFDDGASLESRARQWLHANCSHCHQPDGWTPPGLGMDLRWSTPLAGAGP